MVAAERTEEGSPRSLVKEKRGRSGHKIDVYGRFFEVRRMRNERTARHITEKVRLLKIQNAEAPAALVARVWRGTAR